MARGKTGNSILDGLDDLAEAMRNGISYYPDDPPKPQPKPSEPPRSGSSKKVEVVE